MIGGATGAYGESGPAEPGMRRPDHELMAKAGVPEEQVASFRKIADDPGSEINREDVVQTSRVAAWWALLSVVISLTSVIVGALVGSGELPVPIPIIGVRKTTMVTRP